MVIDFFMRFYIQIVLSFLLPIGFHGHSQQCSEVMSSAVASSEVIENEIEKLKSELVLFEGKVKNEDWVCKKRQLSIYYVRNGMYQLAENQLFEILSNNNIGLSHLVLGLIKLELGNVQKLSQKYDLSLDNYIHSIEEFKQSENFELMAIANVSLGEYYRSIGKYDLAMDFVEQGLGIFESHHLIASKGFFKGIGRKAAILNETNRPYESINWSNKVLEYGELTNDISLQTTALNEIGFSYLNMQKYDSSMLAFKRAEKILDQISPSIEAAHVKYNKAMCFSRSSEDTTRLFRDSALVLFRDVLTYVKVNKIDYPLSEVYQYILTQFDYMKQYDSLAYYQRIFYTLHIDQLQLKANKKIYEIQESYQNKQILLEKEKVQNDLKILEAENSEKSLINKVVLVIITLVLIILLVLVVFILKTRRHNLELKKSNELKDILIKEIHHRVKNNMQMVSSLLDIQSGNVKDEASKEALKIAEERINSLALAHQNLFEYDDYGHIRLKEYLELVINNLLHGTGCLIDLQIDDQIKMEIERAQSLGFITNELITNSLKHAWINKGFEDKRILVSITQRTKRWYFVYEDNGVGLTPDFDVSKSKSLGIKLVNSFASRKLNGQIQFSSSDGLEVTIEFD